MAHKVDTKWSEPGLDNGDIIGDSSGNLPEDIDGLILNHDWMIQNHHSCDRGPKDELI